jgi:hypothetical protein
VFDDVTSRDALPLGGESVLERAFQAIVDAHFAPSLDSYDELLPDASVLTMLEQIDFAALDQADAVRALVLTNKLVAHAQAMSARLAAVIGANPGPDDWAREEIAAALNVSLHHSNQLLTLGRAFEGTLADTGEALLHGDISYQHAVAIVDGMDDVENDPGDLEQRLLERAKVERVGVFRKTVQAETAKADTSTYEERCAKAQHDRKVSIYPDKYAMGGLAAHLPAPTLMAFDRYLDACADQSGPDDERTRAQLRADAMGALIAQALAQGGLPEHHGLPVTLNVTATQESLFRQTDTPAVLDGFGPIPAWMARDLAADAEWRMFIVDAATAYLRAMGTESYRPGGALREFLIAKHGECQFGVCGRDALFCDLDHAVPYPEGATEPENMGPKCRRHHRCKHGPWTFVQNADGSGIWTSPLGFQYRSEPRRYPLDP